jgi:hypothetical protein
MRPCPVTLRSRSPNEVFAIVLEDELELARGWVDFCSYQPLVVAAANPQQGGLVLQLSDKHNLLINEFMSFLIDGMFMSISERVVRKKCVWSSAECILDCNLNKN